MSQDTIDLVKAMVAIFAVFAISTLAMLYLLVAYRLFGGNLPVIGSLPAYQPGAAVPMLVETRFLVALGRNAADGERAGAAPDQRHHRHGHADLRQGDDAAGDGHVRHDRRPLGLCAADQLAANWAWPGSTGWASR